MKFSDKLFLITTAIMVMIFTLFGIWLMSSFFQRILNREIEQGNTESQMFQYMFEIAYTTLPKEYSDEYSRSVMMDSVIHNISKKGYNYYIFDMENNILIGSENIEFIVNNKDLKDIMQEKSKEIQKNFEEKDTYGYQICEKDGSYYFLSSCKSECGENRYFLAMQKDITDIYEDREILNHQYYTILVLLLVIEAIFIYIMSNYLTKPIRKLTKTTKQIADGDYQMRSKCKTKDEIGELSKSFNKMADNLVEKMREKELEAKKQEDFTAAFAHELKTPLTSIIGYADMLCTMKLSEDEIQEAAYYIYSQGKRLEKLSYKLLNLVNLDKQNYDYSLISINNLSEMIQKVTNIFSKQKNIIYEVELENGIIYGDSDLLVSLFYNLLDNSTKAIENSQRGKICILGRNKEDGYEFKIIDNGRGIPSEEISRITEAFYMVDKSRARKEGGAGIGMALCQKIINLHNAKWEIESKLEEGTQIYIWIPKREIK